MSFLNSNLSLLIFLSFFLLHITGSLSKCVSSQNATASDECYRGQCENEKCICDQGWTGDSCDECEGRVLLTENEGIITDGPRNYTEGMECSWLIQPALTNHDDTIRLNVMEYASECGWDYLYIYDGDSAFSPLLATFTGYIIDGNKSNQDYRPEVVSSSNSLFLYFSSDVAYSMMGFYIKYSTHSCPQNCSGNGVCDGTSKICSCDSMWTGNACERDTCPGNCSQELNRGNCFSAQCDCNSGFQADDCSETIPAKQGFWTYISLDDTTLNTNKASHGSVIYNETMYVFGGIQFGNLSNQDGLFKYNTLTDQWSVFEAPADSPSPRYGHSMVLDGETIVVFGGRDTTSKETFSELWQFDIQTNNWTLVEYTTEFSNNSNTAILSLWGHSATLVEFENSSKIMVVMFGHNPLLEYSGFVFEYNIGQRNWIIPEIRGVNVNPTYGHTATLDPVNEVIYVHGGYASMIFKVTDMMYRYDPYQRMFTFLRPSGVPRFLHASVLAGGVLYVEGGCTHNDSDRSTGARCFSPRLMAYYLSCDLWEHLPEAEVYTHPARYGHSANLHALPSGTKSMLIYGGYDSTMLGNMLSYQFGSCLAYSTNEACIGTHHPGISCYWNETNGSCLAVESAQQFNQSSCRNLNDSSPAHCSKDNCETVEYCTRFKSCSQCQIAKCQWKITKCTERTDNTTASCGAPCGSFITCGDCTGNNVCMWCVNKGLCVSTNSYVVQFPYGECMKWITDGKDCSAKVGCSHLGLCRECQTNPFCGWCDDGSNTGLGSCQSGAANGSVYGNSSSNVISTPTQDVYGSPPACQSENWYFTDCPICQCNGHSECVGNTSDCEKCQDRTTGDTCQTCVDGYFGDATNGGSCGPCVCNNQATSCNATTGDCHCSTKGIIGSQCERCEISSKYRGDPTNGTCYYQLSINYSYNFSLNVLQDRYVTAINFENTPPNDNDVEVTFTSNKPCNVRVAIYLKFAKPSNNLSRRKRNIASNRTEDQFNEQELQVEKFIMTRSFKIDLSGGKYDFGQTDSQATVRLYVDNLTLPIWIQISMVQRNTNLLMLLLILFSCFLALLLLTALGWKVKMFYDSCQIRRQRTEMLEQMAARPFATLHLCLDDLNDPKQEQTSDLASEAVYAVTEEYCIDGLSSPVSVLMVMPSGCEDSGSQLTVDQPIHSTKEFPVQCSLGFGTALLMTSGRQDVTHRLQKRNSTINASHQKKLRVVFRKGGRRSHSGRSRRDQCGTQIDSNNSNNSDGNGPIRDRESSSVSRTALNNANQPTAARHGRHSFIPTIRSRSVSPTGGGMDDSQQQRSSTTRSPTTPMIVFSVNNPDMTHNSL